MPNTTPKGAVFFARCPTHGRQTFVDDSREVKDTRPRRISCPYCQLSLTSGESQVGSSFYDSRGVLYVVDERGRARHFSKLSTEQKKRIQEARKNK